MSNNTSNSSGGGIGVLGIMGIVFVTLKLCNVIAWSWWWVTCPFWGAAALFIILFLLTIGAFLLKESISSKKRR